MPNLEIVLSMNAAALVQSCITLSHIDLEYLRKNTLLKKASRGEEIFEIPQWPFELPANHHIQSSTVGPRVLQNILQFYDFFVSRASFGHV